jgi:hypothetical protein
MFSFFYDVIYDDSSHIIILVEINWEPVLLELKYCVDGRCISTSCCSAQVVLVVIIDSALEVFYAYCHNPLLTYI